jgi:ubiquinone/menaquinone biosynthesis C-methylase UbiE
MNTFDRVAESFEQHRPLPSHVPIAIRRALHEHAGIDGSARILEIGCGTGRIGAPFIAARDNYVGVDLSLPMLHEFQRKDLGPDARLVCADGCLLPFTDSSFRAVFMVHLSAVHNWRVLLSEARRVLEPDGVLATGLIEGPPDGIDAAMRNRLNELIANAGITGRSPGRRAASDWLAAKCSRHLSSVTAVWTVGRSPRQFLRRKLTGARFMSLAANVRQAALQSLADWAEQSIGPLDRATDERHHFSLKLYWFE